MTVMPLEWVFGRDTHHQFSLSKFLMLPKQNLINLSIKHCVFIGYSYGKKGYKLYDLDNHKTFVSRDIVFHENVFPFSHVSSNNPPHLVFSLLPPNCC